MLMVLALIPAVLSFLLLGAHFLREGNYLLVGMSVMMPLLFLVRAPFTVRAMQVLLVMAGGFWLLVLRDIVNIRIAEGRAFRAAVIILTSVAAWNLLSALLLQVRRVREHYWRNTRPRAL
jgi:hypothetical protein